MAVDSIFSDATARELAAVYGESSPTRFMDFIDGLLLVVAAMPEAEAFAALQRVGVHHSHLKRYREVAKHRGLTIGA